MVKEAMKFQVKKVTPKSLAVLNSLGLLNTDNGAVIQNKIDLALDQNKLKTLCEAIFEGDFSQTDFEEIDLGAVNKGLSVFLLGWLAYSQSSG